MLNKIPPKYLYPGIVISILMLSIISNVVLIIRATSDQGPQIIENYYEKAANYNDTIAAREESMRLGWTTQIVPHKQNSPSKREIDFVVFDANKQPLNGANGHVELFNPAKSKAVGEADLKQTTDGTYKAMIEGDHLDRQGLYDIVIHLTHDGSHFTQTVRRRI